MVLMAMDTLTPYSKCTTPYIIGLWRKSCDQKHGCQSEIFLSTKSAERAIQMSEKVNFMVSLTKSVRCRALYDTVHFQPCDLFFLLYPLMSGVVTSDSVMEQSCYSGCWKQENSCGHPGVPVRCKQVMHGLLINVSVKGCFSSSSVISVMF